MRALREMRELPAPRGLPVLGNMLQIRPESMHRTLEAWSRELGPMFRFRIGRREMLAVADHELMGTILRDRPDGFLRPQNGAVLIREMGLQVGVFSANGEAWKHQRRMVMAGFDPRHLRAYFPSLVTVTGRLHERWRKAARARAPIDLQADLMRFTVDAIAGLAFGADVDTLSSDDDVIQRHVDRIFPMLWKRMLAPFPRWRYFKRAEDRELDRSVIAVKAAIDVFIAQARARLQAEPARREHPHDLLEAMIAAADLGDSGVTDRDVAGNVLTMLLAGEDTTANTLSWMIYLLARNPAAMRSARAEVSRVVGDAVVPTLEQLAELDYVEACAHETMRLRPVAPMLPAVASREVAIGDVRVPAGVQIIGVMRHDTMDARFFPDPCAFDPARWLAEGHPGRAASASRRVSMPFGAGPRMCPGRNLALMEMKMAMAMLLGRFEIDGVEPAGGGEVRERLAFTMAPVGLRMRLSERG